MKTATIRMKSETTAEILLYDVIGEGMFFGGISAKTFREQVKGVKASTIDLRINSPGGSVTEGAAMLNALDEFKGRIEVTIDGLAASAASVVAMAGDTVQMASNGLLMIHNPYSGVLGTAEDMRREAELLDKVKGQIIDAYKRKSSKSKAQISQWMDAETWFTGQEAVDAGLADSVTEPVRMAAMAGYRDLMAKFKFRKAPDLRDAAAEEETRKRREACAAICRSSNIPWPGYRISDVIRTP